MWDGPLLIQILIVALAAHGSQRFMTQDSWTDGLRNWMAHRGWITNGKIVEGPAPGLRGLLWRYTWKLCSCPFCFGAWCCLLFWILSFQTALWTVVGVFAVRGLQVLFVEFRGE